MIVEMIKARGEKKGLYGARVTGGGNGGTVCVLCGGLSGPESVQQVFKEYAEMVDEEAELYG
jgi:L-arabinokinase